MGFPSLSSSGPGITQPFWLHSHFCLFWSPDVLVSWLLSFPSSPFSLHGLTQSAGHIHSGIHSGSTAAGSQMPLPLAVVSLLSTINLPLRHSSTMTYQSRPPFLSVFLSTYLRPVLQLASAGAKTLSGLPINGLPSLSDLSLV